MKPILLLPLAGLLTSCSSLTTPIYLDGKAPETKKEPTVETASTPLITQTTPTTDLPDTTAPRQSQNNQRSIRRTGNFVQPNVLEIPEKEELKETATSTETAPPPPSITIPTGE